MPLFLVQRSFAERLDLSDSEIKQLDAASLDAGIRWIESFLSADRLQSYCLYEAPSIEALRAASRDAGMPIDSIVEVSGMLGTVQAQAG